MTSLPRGGEGGGEDYRCSTTKFVAGEGRGNNFIDVDTHKFLYVVIS